MTSFYKCCCGYTTKNKEYATFHANHANDCDVREFKSAFPDSGGLIAMVKHAKTTTFIKWYGSEESLVAAHGNVKYKFAKNCDLDYVRLRTEAVHDGIIMTYDADAPIIRNDSAERLFTMVD